MTSRQRHSLDQTSIEVLTAILSATDLSEEGVDAVYYRAQHENQLDILDDLERKGYLIKRDEKYWVTLCGLLALDDATNEDLIRRFEKIFSILRNHYRSSPKVPIKVLDLATLIGLTFKETAKCLDYMIEGNWWQGHSNDFHDPEKASVHPSEWILKYKTFQDVIRQLEEWRQARESEYRRAPKGAPIDAALSSVLVRFDAANIIDAWAKALNRRSTDPDRAITAARTLLESVCKHILDEAGVQYDDKADLPKLYRSMAEHLELAPDRQSETAIKKILGACQTVVEGLGVMRNRLSDSHGKGKAAIKPAPRHAELAVNLAGAMSLFLIETWEARKKP